MSLCLPARRVSQPAWLRNELWRRARAVPSLDLRFAENKSLRDAVTGQSLITFTRASSATYVDSAGVIRTATTDEARFDHNPVTGESLGLLVEEQRTNLLLHNRTLTNAAWVATNITAVKDQTGADGVSSGASSITATAGNGTILQTITSASAARATSAYVRRITGTGTIEMTQDNGSTWTAVTVTNAWTRVTIPSATVTNPVAGFRIVTSGDAIAVDYVQCENGAFSTSAIETTTATVTRSADVVSISGSNFSSWYRQDEGTVFSAFSIPTSVTAAGARVYNISNSDGSNLRWLRLQGGTNRLYEVTDSSLQQAVFSAGTFSAGVVYRGAIGLRANDFGFSDNGSAPTIDTSGTLNTADRMGIGIDASGGAPLNGHLRRLCFWPRRLGNEVLQSITQ